MNSTSTSGQPAHEITGPAGAFPVATGSGEVVRPLGQLWRKCPWSWGIEKFVTMETSAGTLILCELLLVGDGSAMREVVRPIKAAALPDCPNA